MTPLQVHAIAPSTACRLLQELLQDVFAFAGLTSVFVGLGEPGSGLVHGGGAILYTTVFLQVSHPQLALPSHSSFACLRC